MIVYKIENGDWNRLYFVIVLLFLDNGCLGLELVLVVYIVRLLIVFECLFVYCYCWLCRLLFFLVGLF